MGYALKNDYSSFRKVASVGECAADESFTETIPSKQVDAAQFVRYKRIPLMLAVDIEINKAEDNGIDVTALRTYRQALRDVTKQKGFPSKVVWPKVPA